MTALGASPLIQNQLQFNLDVPPSLSNLSTQHRRPRPIVIEKLGQPSHSPATRNPLRFSTLSEDDMDVALRLARRDLKKKRQEIEMEQYLQKMAERASPKVDKKEEERRKARERLLIGTTKATSGKKTQTKKPMRPRTEVLRNQNEERPHSPPTRDTDSYPPKLSQDEKTALEIRRLRREVRSYVDEISKIDATFCRPEPQNLDEDLTDAEYYSKHKARVLGRATRSTRMVYDLKQQVRSIYDDIRYLNPNAEPRLRSEVIKRLASAHRATVRALQDLAHQLPEAGHDDVSKISAELSDLILQLTECCQKLEIGEPKEEKIDKEVRVVPNVWKEVAEGPIEFKRYTKPSEEINDERTKVLKEGLSNLLKMRTPEKKASKPSVIVETKPKVHREKVRFSRPALLVKRRPQSRPNYSVNNKPHYIEPTLSHKSKQKEPVTRQRSRSRSPRPRSPRIVDATAIEQLNLGVPNEWAEEAEAAIKHRLEPLLQKADRIAAQQKPSSIRGLLSEKALDRIEINSGLLVDLIIEDLCKDAAMELMNLETEEKTERGANQLLHGSELHTILDRLDLIDREERDIRERWNSVKFSDTIERPRVKLSNAPITPDPTVVASGVEMPQLLFDHPQRFKDEKSPIIFTNESSSVRLRSEKLDRLRSEALKREYGLEEYPTHRSVLSEDEVADIHEYRQLRLISERKRDRNCRMMEAVTDEIMEELLNAAAEEMMATSSEMDNQLCMQELALGQSLHFSTDTDRENFTENDRFDVNFDEDSCMDLQDMIDDTPAVKQTIIPAENFPSASKAPLMSAGENRGYVDSVRPVMDGQGMQDGFGSDEELEDLEEKHASLRDERLQAEAIRAELDAYEVGHLESVARESGDDDEVTESELSDGPRSNLLGDVDDLEPIRADEVAEEVETEEEEEEEEDEDGDEYSSEFVTTTGTGEDSTATGHDSAR